MKKVGTIAVLLLAGTSAAYADVARLTIRFGGGCVASETGSCTIRVVAEGTELDTEGLWIYTGATSQNLRRLSDRIRPLSATGRATYRIKNVSAGCYRVRTSPNGNDKPDRRSNILCEK